MNKDIETLRKLAYRIYSRSQEQVQQELRAIANRMEQQSKAEPVYISEAMYKHFEQYGFCHAELSSIKRDNQVALFPHPASDEVERLKAERDQYKEDFRITCDAATVTNNQITAIRQAIEKAEQQPIQGTHYGSAALVREIKAILNTINQPQDGK